MPPKGDMIPQNGFGEGFIADSSDKKLPGGDAIGGFDWTELFDIADANSTLTVGSALDRIVRQGCAGDCG
jgi:hypothetical protein